MQEVEGAPSRALLVGRTVVTLGPAGTDAEAEALRLGADVELVESFPTAMRTARDHHELALVAAGYLDPWSEEGSWVDLHFRYRLQMELLSVWQAPTKPICVAARPGQDDGTMDDFRSVAIHPSTRSLLPDRLRNLEVVEVRAKPHAVDLVCRHQVDVCLGSLDVANAAGLRVLEVFEPTMVWCLYGPRQVSGDARVRRPCGAGS